MIELLLGEGDQLAYENGAVGVVCDELQRGCGGLPLAGCMVDEERIEVSQDNVDPGRVGGGAQTQHRVI